MSKMAELADELEGIVSPEDLETLEIFETEATYVLPGDILIRGNGLRPIRVDYKSLKSGRGFYGDPGEIRVVLQNSDYEGNTYLETDRVTVVRGTFDPNPEVA